ncbi:MAG TPA: hypothetical protein VEM40_05285 [Nitrospirota bacterium]|nr:hypothetical protein [Nitrospirota bacterium]
MRRSKCASGHIFFFGHKLWASIPVTLFPRRQFHPASGVGHQLSIEVITRPHAFSRPFLPLDYFLTFA